MNADMEIIRQRLSENDTYIQLGAMEQRLRHLESNNYAMHEGTLTVECA
jgi:hypothetical protein